MKLIMENWRKYTLGKENEQIQILEGAAPPGDGGQFLPKCDPNIERCDDDDCPEKHYIWGKFGKWIASAGNVQDIPGFVGTEFPTSLGDWSKYRDITAQRQYWPGKYFIHRFKTEKAAATAIEYILAATGAGVQSTPPGKGTREYLKCLKYFDLKLTPKIEGKSVIILLGIRN